MKKTLYIVKIALFCSKSMYLDSCDGYGQLQPPPNVFLLIIEAILTRKSRALPFNCLKNMQNDEKNTLNRKIALFLLKIDVPSQL